MPLRKIKTSDTSSELMIRDFEEIIEFVDIIGFNDEFIEIPNVVIFKNSNKISKVNSLLISLSETQIPIVETDEDSFKSMLELINVASLSDNNVIFEGSTKPKKSYLLNMSVIAEKAMVVKYSKERATLNINENIFVVDLFEYHGLGMFVSKNVYKLSAEDFTNLKNKVLN